MTEQNIAIFLRGGGYTSDFYYRYFCVCPAATDKPYMPHPYKWYKTIDIDFFFNFEHLKNFTFFSFSGNPQIEKIFFSSTFDFQKYSAPTFLNIFSKFQKEVLDKTRGHLTTHSDFWFCRRPWPCGPQSRNMQHDFTLGPAGPPAPKKSKIGMNS